MPLTYYYETCETLTGTWTQTEFTGSSPHTVTIATNYGCYIRIRRVINEIVDVTEAVFVTTLNATVLVGVGGASNHVALTWDVTCADTYRVYHYNIYDHTYHAIAEITGESYDDYDAFPNRTNYYFVVPLTTNGFEGPESNIVSVALTPVGLFTMARSSEYNDLQLGVESTAGTGIAASKRLRNMEIKFDPDVPYNVVRHPGSFVSTDTQRAKEYTPASWEGELDFNMVNYVFSSIFGTVTPTQGGTLDYIRRWQPSVSAPWSYKTYTAEQGSSAGAEKYTWLQFSQFSLEYDKETLKISAKGFAQEEQRNITKTAGPTNIAAAAGDPYAVDIYWSEDNITYTKLTDVHNFKFDSGDNWEPVFHANSAEPSYDDVKQVSNGMIVTLALDDASEFDSLRAFADTHTKIFFKFLVTGALIEAGAPNIYELFQLITPVFVTTSKPEDIDGVHGYALTCPVAEDAAVGCIDLKTICKLASATLGV